MKKSILIIFLSIALPFGMMAQFKMPKVNVNDIKEKVITEPEDKPAKEAPKTNTESAPKPSASSNNSSSDATFKSLDFDSWEFEEVQELATVNGYLGRGWALGEIDMRTKHSNELDVPVIDMKFNSPCFEEDLYMYFFKAEDKGKVGGFDFEAYAKAQGLKGNYESELIFVEDDKYILIVYAMTTIDEEMDRYVGEHFPELQRRLPNEL